MAFFLPPSTSTSTTTSLSSSPLRVLPSPEPEDNESEQSRNVAATSASRHRSNDTPMTQGTMFGLLSRQIDYLSGASASEISSLEDSSDSEVESSWTRRATLGDDDGGLDMDMRSPRSSRRDIRSPSRHSRRSPKISGVVELHGPSAGTCQSVRVHQTGGPPEYNSASSTNQLDSVEETTKRRSSSHRRHGSTKIDQSARRQAKLCDRRGHISDTFISRDFILIIILCFGLACAWIVLARPIMMNWFERRSGDEYMYQDM